MKTPITRATFGIIALIAIAVLSNWLVSLTPLGNRGSDFTENRIHTLSEGTKSILKELETPVVIRYYATRNSDYMPEYLKVHMKRVDDLLKEYSNLSDGQVRIENLDPEPDTDAEDSANLDTISGQQINNDNLYLGMAISALDKKVVLPFLNPAAETMLEYEISKAIAEVATASKPTLGIISPFELAGTNVLVPGQQMKRPWVIYQQLKQSFDVEILGMKPKQIDPKKIKALLLIHPTGVTPEVEFLIDQYVLQGGTVIACLDSHSLTAQMTGAGNPAMGQPATPTTSTLPTLLQAWGIEHVSDQVLADPTHATLLSESQKGFAVLNLPQSSMPQEDSIITKSLESVLLYLPGAFTYRKTGELSATTLIRSSERAGFVDPFKASRLDPSLETGIQAEGNRFDLVTHLSGKFPSAFPDGKPKDATEVKPEKEDDTEAPEEPAALKEATRKGNVFLLADADAFFDPFAFQVQDIGGIQMANPTNGNSSLLLNIIDQAIGSEHLIGSRSRAAVIRPFTLIQGLEASFNQEVGDKIAELQMKQDEAQAKLRELQAEKAEGSELYLSPEQEAEIVKFREQQVEYSRAIRELQKDLRRKKDDLAGDITLLNVAVMPVFVIVIGLLVHLKRRSSTKAK